MPPAESARHNRRSRILHTLNIGRMRHATPEERIAALRRLRNENEASDPAAEQSSRRGSRFSRRFSRAFGGSHGGSRRASVMNTSRPVSEIPPAAIEHPPSGMTEMTHPAVEPPASAPQSAGNYHPTVESAPRTPNEPVSPLDTGSSTQPPAERVLSPVVEAGSVSPIDTRPSNATDPAPPNTSTSTPPGSSEGPRRDMSTWYGYR